MKIIVLASALLMGVSLFAAAEAQTRRPATVNYGYVFGEYDYFDAKGGSLNGGGIGAGWRLSRYFGVQAGGQYSRKSGVDFTNGYVEGLLLMPLSSRFTINASIGGAYARAETSVTLLTVPPTVVTVSTSGGGYRAGVGAEYWFAPQWSLRAGFHRQNALGVADDMSVGIGYRF
jgi:hypothetical protein